MKTNYLILLLVAVSLWSCEKDDDSSSSSSLVGTWEWTETESDEYGTYIDYTSITFKADGTGSDYSYYKEDGVITDESSNNFTWSTDGDKLTVLIEDEGEIEGATMLFKVSGNKLTLSFPDEFDIVLTRK